MKAIVFTHYGSPDGLGLKEVPKPAPKEGELLIRVHASSINSWDWEFLSGTPFVNRLMFGLLKPKPQKRILGADMAGTVEAVGKQITKAGCGLTTTASFGSTASASRGSLGSTPKSRTSGRNQVDACEFRSSGLTSRRRATLRSFLRSRPTALAFFARAFLPNLAP